MTSPQENRPAATPGETGPPPDLGGSGASLEPAGPPPDLGGSGASLQPAGPPPDLGRSGASLQPAGPEPARRDDGFRPARRGGAIPRTRVGAVWVGIWAGVVVLILLIIFVAQNTASVEIAFFALEGRIPLALALLIAGVAGAIIAMAVSAFRILQLRRVVRRGR
jgi:uncharacterized integral membrane protein